ncbi:MAG: phosphoribosylaminoimidazolecarboxamide formyltransferase / IMP cyclohydrolase [bacterium P3]|nr:MAG: phosphoribosylaminoimidazolecarboxamide formyltransferase / IMP cyclohydrolase [bacterium P3]KWW40967.1 MAG: phosphoribosylaminoimidazolecarboxamide formyltransferase / IMP cyclohydrolase [bacterium F083]
MEPKKIKSALISVFYKDGLEPVVRALQAQGVTIYSTGGTYKFIHELGVEPVAVESLTGYPSILGGRVKTLHPKVFGGILSRRDMYSDGEQLHEYEIPEIDLVIVDLYPFEQTLASGASEPDIIEKIDIGGISLIRAAAKNFNDVVIVPAVDHYAEFLELYNSQDGCTTLEQRHRFATYAFSVSSHYDSAIFNHFNQTDRLPVFQQSCSRVTPLRYGENPHQQGLYFGDLAACFDQLNGKEISYNNLGDIDAACCLIDDFEQTAFAILKHNNACGVACRDSLLQAWTDALAGDPVSAFGGILVTNRTVTRDVAEEMHKIFFEVCIAPDYDDDALQVLRGKKNRIILRRKAFSMPQRTFRNVLDGVLVQDRDTVVPTAADMQQSVTSTPVTPAQAADLAFATILVKHTKSNAIVLAKNGQLCASGTGQTSRVDALRQAIAKAASFGFDLNGAVMASDAFFPFADCVEIAHQAGIAAVAHPGGSIHDQDSIDFCESHHMGMVITGVRHFKH